MKTIFLGFSKNNDSNRKRKKKKRKAIAKLFLTRKPKAALQQPQICHCVMVSFAVFVISHLFPTVLARGVFGTLATI